MGSTVREVPVAARPLESFEALLGSRAAPLTGRVRALAQRLAGRRLWNVSAGESAGCVAEMLRSQTGYVRGAGLDVHWAVLGGPRAFFDVSKRVQDAIQGSEEAGDALWDLDRGPYEEALGAAAAELAALVRPGDVVVLHEAATAGLIPALARRGAIAIWRCHHGLGEGGPAVEMGWHFLEPYLADADAYVFPRAAGIPWCCPRDRCVTIPPSLDPFSAKNQELSDEVCRAILVHVGIVEGPAGPAAPTFVRPDGSPGRVDRAADLIRLGRPPAWDAPLVVQVARWDRLKDPVGVVRGFAEALARSELRGAELVLAGPTVRSLPEDPDCAGVFDDVWHAWRDLPHARRRRVQLACLPMRDPDEHAAIVNALQRHAAVVVQKNRLEGFGLSVTEAMWKRRPVVATAVGGIEQQLRDGLDGLLLKSPDDAGAFAAALAAVLEDPERAARMGESGRERVAEGHLDAHAIAGCADLIAGLLEGPTAR